MYHICDNELLHMHATLVIYRAVADNTLHQVRGHLPSRRTSPSFRQYQIILLGDRDTGVFVFDTRDLVAPVFTAREHGQGVPGFRVSNENTEVVTHYNIMNTFFFAQSSTKKKKKQHKNSNIQPYIKQVVHQINS